MEMILAVLEIKDSEVPKYIFYCIGYVFQLSLIRR